MSFNEISFIMFFLFVMLLHYVCPPKYRYLIILIANYVFYGFNDLKAILILIVVTAITYIGGLVLGKHERKCLYLLFFLTNIGVLFVLKYTEFALNWIDYFTGCFHNVILPRKSISLIAPIGLSFYVFQSTNYLNDVYRKKIEPERNPFRYAAYVSFFPVILSGPIQKAREILPQLKKPNFVESDDFIRAFMLFLWGCVEKVVVSNRLRVIVDTVWEDYEATTGLYTLVGTVVFSLYIYCDFSAYSDMACGVSRMLGFNVNNNFNNPYLATSLTQFWNHWHMTLNDWFKENVYIPLGGNRKGKIRKYFNIMVVFFFSGAWHGAAMHFIVWGILNGILQIVGQILAPLKETFYTMINIDDDCFSIRMLKRVGVFLIISLTWIFFRAPGTSAAILVIHKILSVRFIDFFNEDIFTICGSVPLTFWCVVTTSIFLFIQVRRKEASKYYRVFRSQPIFFQTLFAGIIIMIIVMASISGNADINTQFIYYQF